MLDISSAPIIPQLIYAGSHFAKRGIGINQEPYMVKLPDPKSKSEQYHMFSEFIGCHIFQILGMLAQKTLLAQYHHRQVRDLYAVEQISLNLREQLTEEIIQS